MIVNLKIKRCEMCENCLSVVKVGNMAHNLHMVQGIIHK